MCSFTQQWTDSATVGRISAVNALIGEQGLLERVHLPPLVVDRQGSAAGVSRGREDTSSDSAGGSGSETEMDRRPRRGRGGRRRRSKPNQRSRQTTFNKVQHTKTTRKEEEVKVQTAAVPELYSMCTSLHVSLSRSHAHQLGEKTPALKRRRIRRGTLLTQHSWRSVCNVLYLQ